MSMTEHSAKRRQSESAVEKRRRLVDDLCRRSIQRQPSVGSQQQAPGQLPCCSELQWRSLRCASQQDAMATAITN